MKNSQHLIDQIINWLFRTGDGKIVIAQFPNWPLWSWLGATILESVIKSDPWHLILYWIATIALVWWAYLEIKEGVNGFRRILGTLVLIFVLYSRIQLI